MRSFFMLLFFAIPIAVVIFYFMQVKAPLPSVGLDQQPQMMQVRAAIDPEVEARMKEVFPIAEKTITTANTKGKKLSEIAHYLGWAGAGFLGSF